MGLRVLTAAASTELVTLAQAKARLGLVGMSKDVQVQELVDGLSTFAAHYLKGTVYQQYEWTSPGSDRRRLLLPLRRVDSNGLAITVDEIAIDDFTLEDAAHGVIFRKIGWPQIDQGPTEDGEDRVVVTFWAGWAPPTKLSTWSAAKVVAVGDWLAPTNAAVSPLLFRVTTGGTTGGTEPAWPSTPGAFAEGSIAYVGARVDRVPADVMRGFWIAFEALWLSTRSPALAGVASDRVGPHERTYVRPSDFQADAVPASALSFWEPYHT